jgi:hypothetical protein
MKTRMMMQRIMVELSLLLPKTTQLFMIVKLLALHIVKPVGLLLMAPPFMLHLEIIFHKIYT